VQVIEDAAQAVPGQRAGAFLDVPVEQRADAHPIRCDQAGPRLVEPCGELVSCARWIGEQAGDQAAVPVVGHGVPAPRELARHLRRPGGADLRQLGAKSRPADPGRRGQKIRHIATVREHGQQRFQVEPGRPRPDRLQPGLMIGAPALISQRLHRGLRLPQWRDGEPHGQQVFSGPQRKQRHRESRYAQPRITCQAACRGCLLFAMPGASEQTRRVQVINANWAAGPDGDHGRFEIQIVTDDGQRHVATPSPASMTALIALTQADTVLAWDPADRTLIAANIVGTMPWTAHPQPGPPAG